MMKFDKVPWRAQKYQTETYRTKAKLLQCDDLGQIFINDIRDNIIKNTETTENDVKSLTFPRETLFLGRGSMPTQRRPHDREHGYIGEFVALRSQISHLVSENARKRTQITN